MGKVKCPRCKSPIKKNDTFCMSCGTPVSSETKKIKEEKIEKKEVKDKVLEVKKDEKRKKQKKNINPQIILLIIIFILISILCYLLFFKEEKKCEKCSCPEQQIKYVEKEPTIQYINFMGYRFSMPLDWNFEGSGSEYKFINEQETMYVLMSDSTSVDYETFISKEYQNTYLETLQTDFDISINRSEEKIKNDVNYYLMEGSYSSYDYILIVTKKEDGIFIIEAQFENNSVYTAKKQEVIDFAISNIMNNKL